MASASSPSPAMPTTSRSGSSSISLRKPSHSRRWSSTISTRRRSAIARPSPRLHVLPWRLSSALSRGVSGSTTSTRQPCPGWGPSPQRPSQQRDALAHAPQAEARRSCSYSGGAPLAVVQHGQFHLSLLLIARGETSSTFVACACLRILVSASCAQR